MTGKGKTEILPLRGRDPAEKHAVRMTSKGRSPHSYGMLQQNGTSALTSQTQPV